jgi:thiol-disulfide isomerase/thioredoxin
MKIQQLLVFVLFLSACSKEKINFKIEGKINGLNNSTIYLYQQSLSGTVPVDSARISEKGKFVLEGFTDVPNFYILFVHKDQYINLLIQPDDKFGIVINAKNFNLDYFIEGSKDSRLILKLISRQAQTLDRITEISNEYERSLNKPDFPAAKMHLDSIYDIVFKEHKQFSIDFILANPGSLVSLMTLYQQLGKQTPVFDYKKDFRYFEHVDSALCSQYPGSEAVKDLNKKVTEIREMLKVEIGSPAPSVTLTDTTGKQLTLASLKGKIVLVNFWASWSAASLEENKYLALLYKKFHSKGFEVYQVSLDKTRESWLNAIRNEKIIGIQVSDLAYWDSPVARLFRIENLPANILLDRNGIIIAKNSMNRELEQKLTEILQ